MKICSGKSSGAAALTMFMGVAIIVGAFATAIAFIALLEGFIGFSQEKSREAYFVAQSGAWDAVRRMALDPTFGAVSPGYTYILTIGNGTTTVTVTEDVPSVGQKEIVSVGDVQTRKRKIRAIVQVDSDTGEVRLISWSEIPI